MEEVLLAFLMLLQEPVSFAFISAELGLSVREVAIAWQTGK